MRFLAVLLTGVVLGGWAVPLGIAAGLGPLATFVGAAGGGLIGCWGFLLAGGRLTERLIQRRKRTASDGFGDASDGRVRRLVDRHGARGLGLAGPFFPGVTASVVTGVALGLDRRSLGAWLSIGIVLMCGLYSLAAYLLIAIA